MTDRQMEHDRCNALDDELTELLSDLNADQLELVIAYADALRAPK